MFPHRFRVWCARDQGHDVGKVIAALKEYRELLREPVQALGLSYSNGGVSNVKLISSDLSSSHPLFDGRESNANSLVLTSPQTAAKRHKLLLQRT